MLGGVCGNAVTVFFQFYNNKKKENLLKTYICNCYGYIIEREVERASPSSPLREASQVCSLIFSFIKLNGPAHFHKGNFGI